MPSLEEKTLEVEGVVINYVQHGTGPNVILLCPNALGKPGFIN